MAAALAISSTAVFLINTGGRAIHNGDEAIYAEMAREMVRTGDYAELRWQGEAQLVRPPLAVWTLVAGRLVFDDERAVRWPLAAAAGVELALVFLLGFVLFEQRSWLAGLTAAGVLATCDLFIGYTRFFESEPVLCLCIVASVLGWELARRRRGWIYLWGGALGAALMTKQIIGAIPLVCPLVEALASDGDRALARRAWRGLVAAAIVWSPWHIVQLARHGTRFVDAYLGHNVVERSRTAILHLTRPTYYARELWRSEGWFSILLTLAVLFGAYCAIRRRRRRDLLLALWALGPFLLFTIATSRYDYYVLVAYPALALAVANLLVALPVHRSLAPALAALWFVTAAGVHLVRDLSSFDGDEEVRALMRFANASPGHADPLYAFNTHAYSSRYYLDDAPASTLLERSDDYQIALHLRTGGMPASVVLATDLPQTLASLPRPFWLLMPRARVSLIPAAPPPVAQSSHYFLFRWER